MAKTESPEIQAILATSPALTESETETVLATLNAKAKEAWAASERHQSEESQMCLRVMHYALQWAQQVVMHKGDASKGILVIEVKS